MADISANQLQRTGASSDATPRPRNLRGVSVWVMMTVFGARR
jgi:hypothetical protein